MALEFTGFGGFGIRVFQKQGTVGLAEVENCRDLDASAGEADEVGLIDPDSQGWEPGLGADMFRHLLVEGAVLHLPDG